MTNHYGLHGYFLASFFLAVCAQASVPSCVETATNFGSARMHLNEGGRAPYAVQLSTAQPLGETHPELIAALESRMTFARRGPSPKVDEIIPVEPSAVEEGELAAFFSQLKAYRPYSEEVELFQFLLEGGYEAVATIDENDGTHDAQHPRVRIGLLPTRAPQGITLAHTFFHELKHLRDTIENPFYRHQPRIAKLLSEAVVAGLMGEPGAQAKMVKLRDLGRTIQLYGELRANQVIQPDNFFNLTVANGYTREELSLPFTEATLRSLGSELYPRIEELMIELFARCSLALEEPVLP